MAKTIRSHPTSPFVLPEPFWVTFLIFFKMWTLNGPTLSSFSDIPIDNQTGPQKKNEKNAHGHSLKVSWLSICDLYIVFIMI